MDWDIKSHENPESAKFNMPREDHVVFDVDAGEFHRFPAFLLFVGYNRFEVETFSVDPALFVWMMMARAKSVTAVFGSLDTLLNRISKDVGGKRDWELQSRLRNTAKRARMSPQGRARDPSAASRRSSATTVRRTEIRVPCPIASSCCCPNQIDRISRKRPCSAPPTSAFPASMAIEARSPAIPKILRSSMRSEDNSSGQSRNSAVFCRMNCRRGTALSNGK